MVKLTTKIPAQLSALPLFQGFLDSSGNPLPLVGWKSLSPAPSSGPSDPDLGADRDTTVITATAKPKARQHTPPDRERRRVIKDRYANFEAAARFAYDMDWPINLAITINWTALIRAGEHNAGNCLGRDEVGREAYLRSELSRFTSNTAPRTPFVAIWGRDIDATMGIHTHIGLHCSRQPPKHLLSLVAQLERVCGSRAEPFEENVGRYRRQNILAESVCKGWQIKQIYGPNHLDGALKWIDYIAGQSERHHEWPDMAGKTFGVSQAIGRAARAAQLLASGHTSQS